MCRHLAWFGAPRTLSSLILDPAHGLLEQSWAPRRQRHGTVNADGWGVGFFPDPPAADPGPAPAAEPHGAAVRWRSDRPLWSELNFAAVAPHLSSGRVVAAVRSATAGMPLDASAAAPFLAGGWLISHNGRVDRTVVGVCPEAESMCDSALLAARVVADGIDRLGETLANLAAADPAARLNLIMLGPDRLLATTWGDTLSWRRDSGGVLVASEPDAGPGWVDVPDHSLLTVTADGVSVSALEVKSR